MLQSWRLGAEVGHQVALGLLWHWHSWLAGMKLGGMSFPFSLPGAPWGQQSQIGEAREEVGWGKALGVKGLLGSKGEGTHLGR